MSCDGEAKIAFDRIDCATAQALLADPDGDGLVSGTVVLHRDGAIVWTVEISCDNCPDDYNPAQDDVCSANSPAVTWRGGGGCVTTDAPATAWGFVVVLVAWWWMRRRVGVRAA